MLPHSLLLSLLLAPIAAAAEEAVPDVRDRVPLERFVIQAHRGGGFSAPENTLETFRSAWELGLVPEGDVRMSKDGVLCTFHDESFARLVKSASKELQKKGVADLSWQELQQLDVGAYMGEPFAGQRIPKVEDVFRAMAGHPRRWFYLDVKRVSLERLAELAKQHRVQRQLILATTHHEEIRQWKKLLSESQTLLWMRGTEAELADRLKKLDQTDFEGVTSLQIHVFVNKPGSSEPFSPSPVFLRGVGRTLRSRGITFQALAYGKHGPEVYRTLMELGVESFATDHPKMTLQAVKDYYAERKAAEKK